MRIWFGFLVFLALTALGSCNSPIDDHEPDATEIEQFKKTTGADLSAVASGVSPEDVLGANCGVNHGCKWEQLPNADYPHITNPTEASCSVQLTVGDDGLARDVLVECDDPRFDEVTKRAISSMKHSVNDVCGTPCSIIGQRIEYPIEYRLED